MNVKNKLCILLTHYFNSVLLMTSSKCHFCYDVYNCQTVVFPFSPSSVQCAHALKTTWGILQQLHWTFFVNTFYKNLLRSVSVTV